MGWAQLQGAELNMVELEGAYLNNANLRGVDLAHARLAGSYLENAALQGADLSYAHLHGVFLPGAQLQGAVLTGVHLTGAYVEGISIWGAITTGAEEVVLTDQNGAEPIIINIPPDASDIRRWAADMPYWDDEKKYVRRMLESKADSRQFISLHADNAGSVNEMVKLTSGSSDEYQLSRIALKTYLQYLTISRHPARTQVLTKRGRRPGAGTTS